jgi:hypothetical protein
LTLVSSGKVPTHMLRGLLSYFGEQRIAKVHNGQDRDAAREFQQVLWERKSWDLQRTPLRPLRESLFLYSERVQTRFHHSS